MELYHHKKAKGSQWLPRRELTSEMDERDDQIYVPAAVNLKGENPVSKGFRDDVATAEKCQIPHLRRPGNPVNSYTNKRSDNASVK